MHEWAVDEEQPIHPAIFATQEKLALKRLMFTWINVKRCTAQCVSTNKSMNAKTFYNTAYRINGYRKNS